jgi:endo-1,4-beta-D-glucanase Y
MLQVRSARWSRLALVAAALLMLDGCGGSNGDDGTGGDGGTGGSAGSAGKGGSGGGGAGTGGSGGSGITVPEDAMVPFGSHPMPYPPDVKLPTGDQATLDKVTATAYDNWKKKYLKQGCGGWYVYSGGGTGTDVGDMVSEGQGYGMLIVALMAGHDPDAQAIYDGLYRFAIQFPTGSHKYLMAWTVDVAGGCKLLKDQTDSATDGDLDMTYSMLLADKQWPGNGWGDKFKKAIVDIKAGDINATTHETLLGDSSSPGDPEYMATRPSDFMMEHIRAFGSATGDSAWMQTVDATYTLVATLQGEAPKTGLVPDFVINTDTSPTAAPPMFQEGPGDGAYDYNSCRVPWRVTTDYIVSKDPRAKAAVDKINTWIIGAVSGNPDNILDGYNLDGTLEAPTGDRAPSKAFSSPFAVSAMVSGNQDWLDKLWNSRAIDEDYFADSITMISMIVLSGNWWAP